MTGSNRRPPACKAGALPAELILRVKIAISFSLLRQLHSISQSRTVVRSFPLSIASLSCSLLPILTGSCDKLLITASAALMLVQLLCNELTWLGPATSYSHRGKPPTTIGAEELNFRVRYGNGCDLFAIITRLFFKEFILSKLDKDIGSSN